MSRVLMAWELGANMGHIDRMLITARALRERGHAVTFALKDLARAHGRIVADGFPVLQSPLWLPRMVNPPKLVNYSAVLAAAGWLDPGGLAGLLSAWRGLFELHRPDLLVCDHAPTAMLAMRGRGTPIAAIGNCFEIPPHREVFPAMNYWDKGDVALCARSDALLLAPVNQALALLGDSALPRLTALFGGVRCIAASLPELAHYPDYDECVRMVGPSYVGDSGVAPQWPAGEGARVFVYLSPEHADFNALMEALRQSGMPTLVHAKGLSPDAARRLGGPSIRFESSPVRMDPAVRAAALVVSHASLGTVSAAALAGRPQLVLPNHMEQYMVARRIVDGGFGLAVPPGSRKTDYPALLRRLLDEKHFAEAARALAQRHAGADPAKTGACIAEELEALLR
ncbi:MAG: udp-glucuronosyltransferase [Methyloversatilis sp.]|jgi:UDP:flavonoid glycosyltransferase YjiC (YdhE family)|nr:udp-glucuronosyltransferase [Methyloversatilis sp.]